MSNSSKESIFMQSDAGVTNTTKTVGGNNFNVDLLSATSEPNWTKVSASATGVVSEKNVTGVVSEKNESKKILSEINHLLSEVRKTRMAGGSLEAQAGGAKKSGKKAKKDKKKTSTGKKMKRSSTGKKNKKGSTGKKMKKASTGKKQTGSGKGSGLMLIREVAKMIVSEVNLKDGIPMNTIASKILKQNDGSVEKASEWVRSNKSKVTKMYEETKKQQDANREAKKAEKAAKKAQSTSSASSSD